jgi:hypothetical protein
VSDGGVGPGKRAGSRRGRRAPVRLRRDVVLYAAAIVASAGLWLALVFLAIRWGAAARSGEGPGWVAFGMISAVAVATLFAGLMLVSRLSRALGLSSSGHGQHGSHR